MTEEIPRIHFIQKASSLYKGYQDAVAITGSRSGRRTVQASELQRLDGLLKNADAYLGLARNLDSMRRDLSDFQASMEEGLEDVITCARGQFQGRRAPLALLELIPYMRQGEERGSAAPGASGFEKLTSTIPSYHQWLKDFLAYYVAEINKALAPVEGGEPDGRLKIEIDRMNNAMRDCYQEHNMVRLKLASRNLTGGLTRVRELLFPVQFTYPEKDHISQIAEGYLASIRELRASGEGKEKISFSFSDFPPRVHSFEDETPRPQGGLLTRLFSH
ncbi:hypothetical protein D6789_00325 [Candidatus Woesearchaeota archaeon]|nr:MAG: hypothetical protein D6789_00325 [Candidatus Woesearchaeota archaeon]